MRGYLDKLADAGFSEVVMFCNAIEIEQGDLPEYCAAKKMRWWADTIRAIYLSQKKKTMDALAKGIHRDYFAETMERCEQFKALAGYVIDDSNLLDPTAFEEVAAAIRAHSKKTIVASFKADADIAPFLATITRHQVKVARQLYRQDAADEKVRDHRTISVTRWLKNFRCDVANLEYFRAEGVVTSADDLGAMYSRCIDAGVVSFQGYAAVDANGFKVWDYPDLWLVLKQLVAHHREYMRLLERERAG